MTISDEAAAELSRRLLEAERTGQPIEPLVGAIPVGDIDSAYLVQSASTRLKLQEGRRIVGRKIGLTNPKVQAQLDVDQPDFGVLFDDMRFDDGAIVPAGSVLQPKVEAELAFVMNDDLIDPDVTEEHVASAIGEVRVAIEIVGSRIAEWRIGIVDTVADNASSGAFVLGDDAVSLAAVDLLGCTMIMRRSAGAGAGDIVSEGTGADCLGSPLVAGHWLARELARRGDPLRRGDIVLSGALGPMVGVASGDHFDVEVIGVGTVSISFA